jgi:uncharacterized protein
MTNHLATEASPYLRQHADNPVDWHPWDDAALALARESGKPILLSIGYSACHWCHVMAHESFEDASTARVMNDLFVNIKVDREERPDIDKIYQLAHQALTRRGGGWPLTVFLTPDDHLPFYAGTYFPKDARFGMPPFVQVLQQVRAYWDTRRDDVRKQNSALNEFLQEQQTDRPSSDALTDAPIRVALARFEQSFDRRYGGHVGAPKFPHCPEMELLLERGSTDMIDITLAHMARGGIHDQIGGGFCRYSVDERWEIPHFEKMLYDNAQLLPLYAARRDVPSLTQTAHALVAWLQREMTASDGGFFSALDADSEHEEGKFYVWQRDEVRALLDADEFSVVDRIYGFDRPPNFEQHAWNPIIAQTIDEASKTLGIDPKDTERRFDRARKKLFEARSVRVRPGLDDKILTSWNALMIGGLAHASRPLGDASMMKLADAALGFLHRSAWSDDRLFAKAGADRARFPAYLDDYAFLLDALLECLQCRWSQRDLDWTIRLAEGLLHRFEDKTSGGFFFTAHDHEKLIQRPKSWTDEAVPSGNGIAARALLRLGHLIGETRYIDAAERTLRAAWPTLQQIPHGCASLLRALNDLLDPRTQAVVRFSDDDEEMHWRAAFDGLSSSRQDIYFIAENASTLLGTLASQKYLEGGVAYVCRGTQCLPPIGDSAELVRALDEWNTIPTRLSP